MLNVDTDDHAQYDLVIGTDYEAAIQLRSGLRTAIQREHPRYACSMCAVLVNLLDNAERYRTPETAIELRLKPGAFSVELAVFNQGPAIPEAGIEQIFDLGVSDGHQGVNSGLGLFASRIYALAMEATLTAHNEPTGVSFSLQFPWRAGT